MLWRAFSSTLTRLVSRKRRCCERKMWFRSSSQSLRLIVSNLRHESRNSTHSWDSSMSLGILYAPFLMLDLSSSMLRPVKGCDPVSIWNKRVPRDQTSALNEYCMPLISSGAIASGVPANVLFIVVFDSTCLARPMSPSLNSKSMIWVPGAPCFLFASILSSLISRCMMLFSTR